jgi:hypothetical protein
MFVRSVRPSRGLAESPVNVAPRDTITQLPRGWTPVQRFALKATIGGSLVTSSPSVLGRKLRTLGYSRRDGCLSSCSIVLPLFGLPSSSEHYRRPAARATHWRLVAARDSSLGLLPFSAHSQGSMFVSGFASPGTPPSEFLALSAVSNSRDPPVMFQTGGALGVTAWPRRCGMPG